MSPQSHRRRPPAGLELEAVAEQPSPEVEEPRFAPSRQIARNLAKQYPETFGYRVKNALLGKPLATEQLESERLSKPVALGVLAPDCISSSAYGAEEMLTQLTPFIGLAAFTLIVPITFAILGVLFFVTMSYFDVIGAYTKFGGSYIVSRDNFGYKIAQIAAVALLIDYTVTVAVQTSAGTAALTSAVPSLSSYTLEITLAVVVLLIYGNLRGIKEAGKFFAFPTYFYIVALGAVILIGVAKKLTGSLEILPIPNHSLLFDSQFGHSGTGFLMGLAYLQLLRSFANGGSSLTGLEAISDSVAAFKKPEALNARKTLLIMSGVLSFLVLGTSLLASWTHAVPFASGTPTVVSQEVKAVLGTGAFGHIFFLVVQFGTMLILYTGGNTSFNGFPFLANFVAGDRFLPIQMTKRGHRLAFSNGVIVLGTVAIILVIAFDAKVSGLVALYAVGVFTGFTMAGFGMVKHHLDRKDNPKWRRGVVINGISGGISMIVVVIFVAAKFFEGAWLIVVIGPILYLFLLRLNKQYKAEEAILRAQGPATQEKVRHKHQVLVLVDRYDLATARAISYARTLSQHSRAVHFDIDPTITGELRRQWAEVGPRWLPLDIIECQDRRLERATLELVADEVADEQTEVTILLPRRSFGSRLTRILHDRTADAISAAVSVVPNVSATIIPFNLVDLQRGERLEEESVPPAQVAVIAAEVDEEDLLPADLRLRERGAGSEGISEVVWRQRAKVAGRIRSVRVQRGPGASNLECTISDGSGSLLLIFQGRPTIPGIETGARLVVEGMVGSWEDQLAMLNPDYEIVAGASHDSPGH